MPNTWEIRRTLGISSNATFSVRLTIIVHKDTQNDIAILGNNSEYLTYNWNGNTDNTNMSICDTLEVIIMNDGTDTWGQIIGALR